MSVLDDFARIRLYRGRASEFELLAETEVSPDVRLRFRIVARHYRELMDRELQADNARMAELIERARLERQQGWNNYATRTPGKSHRDAGDLGSHHNRGRAPA